MALITDYIQMAPVKRDDRVTLLQQLSGISGQLEAIISNRNNSDQMTRNGWNKDGVILKIEELQNEWGPTLVV